MKNPDPCTLAAKHAWQWQRNITLKNMKMTARGTTIEYKFRGLYQCPCGAKKHGQTQYKEQP